MSMMIQINPVQPSERQRWGELWAAYQAFYRVSLSAAVTDSLWERLHNGRVQGLGARDPSGDLVGIVHFLFHEDTWSALPACYLQDLYVEPRLRGTGCGRRLIEAVAAASQRAGANPPYWLTHETNTVARQLYDRLAQNQGFLHYVYGT